MLVAGIAIAEMDSHFDAVANVAAQPADTFGAALDRVVIMQRRPAIGADHLHANVPLDCQTVVGDAVLDAIEVFDHRPLDCRLAGARDSMVMKPLKSATGVGSDTWKRVVAGIVPASTRRENNAHDSSASRA